MSNKDAFSFLDSDPVEDAPAQEEGGGHFLDSDPVEETAPKSQRELNPPTMLSSAVHGFEQGALFNLADDTQTDPIKLAEQKERFKNSEEENPMIFGLSQLAGAVFSPVNKLGQLAKAGQLVQAAVTGARTLGEAAVSAYGASEKKGLDALKEGASVAKDPLTVGMSALSGGFKALPTIVEKGGNIVVKDGKKAFKVGTEMKDALASPEGQAAVTRATNLFGEETVNQAVKAFDTIDEDMVQLATKNADVKVNVGSALENAYKGELARATDQMDPTQLPVANRLKAWLSTAEKAFLGSTEEGKAAVGSFQTILEKKQELGNKIWKAKEFNKSPEVKRDAVNLYWSLSKALEDADTTKTFKTLNTVKKGLIGVQDAADDLGGALRASDNLAGTSLKKRDALIKAYNTIPEDFRQKMTGLNDLITKKMDTTMTAYNLAAKASGKNPEQASLVRSLLDKLPILSESSRVQGLNRLGRESAGSAAPVLTKTLQGAGLPNAATRMMAPSQIPLEEDE